jgi:hypothetical protein
MSAAERPAARRRRQNEPEAKLVRLQADTGKLGDSGLESPINVIVSGLFLRHRNEEGVPGADGTGTTAFRSDLG